MESGESEAWASLKNQSSTYHANCSQLQFQAREIGTNRIGLISISNIYMQLSDEYRRQLLGLILCLIQCVTYENREELARRYGCAGSPELLLLFRSLISSRIPQMALFY